MTCEKSFEDRLKRMEFVMKQSYSFEKLMQ